MKLLARLPSYRSPAARRRRNRESEQPTTVEVLEDRQMLSVDPVTGLYDEHFDFGTAFSPVAPDATSVNYTNTYNSTAGFGWLSGAVDSRDRGASYGDDLTRDFNFTADGTFVVDVPDGEYEITITLGDGLALRDNMGVFLEGVQVDSVTSQAGQYETRTYNVTVSDGQLTLRLDDLDTSGSNIVVMINSMEVVQIAEPPPPPPPEEPGLHFDFGTAFSPVASNATHVNYTTTYSSSLGYGYGWTQGVVDSRDRGVGDDLVRDFNLTEQATFLIDLESGVYEITLTMGDAIAARDEMGVFFEGQQYDSVTTQAGEYAIRTYTVTINDGQLTMLLDDLGGSDGIAVINGMDIVKVGDDVLAPSVVSTNPDMEIAGSFDRIQVTFNEAIDPTSFAPEDVTLTGPNGEVAITGVNQISDTTFEIVFDEQTTLGEYTLALGAGITDLAGNELNQDGQTENATLAAASTGGFMTTIRLIERLPIDELFDFGDTGSPVGSGATGVTFTTTYTAAQGYGWLEGDIASRDRGIAHGDELQRDFNLTTDGIFVLDVPEGEFDVTITMGDGIAARDQMGIFLEGNHVGTVSTAAGEYATRTFRVVVTDGQLTLRLTDLGGDPVAVINSLHIVEVEPTNDPGGDTDLDPMERLERLKELRRHLRRAIRGGGGEHGDLLTQILADWETYLPGKSRGRAFGRNPNATLSMYLRTLNKEIREARRDEPAQLDALFSSSNVLEELNSSPLTNGGGRGRR